MQNQGHVIETVFDIGANRGMWTKKMLGLLPDAKFCMFEANKNLSMPNLLNKSEHKWYNVVLSKPGIDLVDFYFLNQAGTGDSYYKENTTHYRNVLPDTMYATTLDSIVSDDSLRIPQLLKLDTQGSELDVLEGALGILEYVDIILTEIPVLSYNKDAPSFCDYIDYMHSIGFVPVGVEQHHFSDNFLIQMDLVFLRSDVKEKYYGNNGRFIP